MRHSMPPHATRCFTPNADRHPIPAAPPPCAILVAALVAGLAIAPDSVWAQSPNLTFGQQWIRGDVSSCVQRGAAALRARNLEIYDTQSWYVMSYQDGLQATVTCVDAKTGYVLASVMVAGRSDWFDFTLQTRDAIVPADGGSDS